MNAMAQSPLLVHLAWSLIHFLWQGALVGLAYWCMRYWLRKATPQSRYLLALSTLLILVLLPICTFFYLDGWQVHKTAAEVALPTQALVSTDGIHLTLPVTPIRQAFPYLSWIVWLWLAGVTFMGARALWGWRQAVKLQTVSTTLAHPWQTLLTTLQEKMQISRAIQLLESARVQAPVVIGWLKPVILIPPSTVCGLDWRQAEMILVHELAHIRRHDYVCNLLQIAVETLLFYHPVVHWISRDARNEREFCCDDMVMRTCGDRLSYLKALAELEQQRLHASAALAANGGALLNRAYRLAYRIEPIVRLPVWSAALVVLAALLAATLLVYPRHAPMHSDTQVSASVQPKPLFKTITSAAGDLEVARIHPTAPHSVLPAPTRLTLPTAKIQPVQLSVISLSPLVITPLAAVSQPQLAEVSVPEAPGITIVAPHPLPQPEYPNAALRDGLGGTVQVSFRVSASGQATDIHTQMISGPMILASTARAALENWQFKPVQINGQTLTPRVNLEFVFNAESDSRSAGSCAMVTGSHVCRRYRISLQNLAPGGWDGGSGVAANQSRSVKLAVVKNAQGILCRPQDPCFFAASQPGWGHEQRIREQFRALSQGFIPTGGSF